METPSRSLHQPEGGRQYGGHAHFWERALSRGVFLRTAALTAGAAASADLWTPPVGRAAVPFPAPAVSLAQLGAAAPKPIPGGINPGVPGGPALIHVNLPASSTDDQITITDFMGEMGVAHLQGTGKDGTGAVLTFDADMRFMRGVYVGTDGNRHVTTLGFV